MLARFQWDIGVRAVRYWWYQGSESTIHSGLLSSSSSTNTVQVQTQHQWLFKINLPCRSVVITFLSPALKEFCYRKNEKKDKGDLRRLRLVFVMLGQQQVVWSEIFDWFFLCFLWFPCVSGVFFMIFHVFLVFFLWFLLCLWYGPAGCVIPRSSVWAHEPRHHQGFCITLLSLLTLLQRYSPFGFCEYNISNKITHFLPAWPFSLICLGEVVSGELGFVLQQN